jgi:RsiW-degrading membrane proteinase PrsW (M82 family)
MVLLFISNAILVFVIKTPYKFENTNLHYILNVGLEEELFKFLAFLATAFILKIKDKKELIICFIVSHTMFALLENWLYYLSDKSTLNNRYITGVLAHSAWGAIQATALFYGRKWFALAFVVCVLWHGLHDILVTDELQSYVKISLAIQFVVALQLLSRVFKDEEEPNKPDSTIETTITFK